MDIGFDFNLIWFVLIIYVLIRRLLKRKPKRPMGKIPQPVLSPTVDKPERHSEELAEALREIRTALGFPGLEMERPAETAPPEPVPPPASPAPRPAPPEQPHPWETPFAAEDTFEQTGRHDREQPTSPATKKPPASFHYGISRKPQAGPWQRKLSSRNSLREMFAIKEILDLPIALRRRR